MRTFGLALPLLVVACGGRVADEPRSDAAATSWSTTFTASTPYDTCAAGSPTGAAAVAIETVHDDESFQLEVRLFDENGVFRWEHDIDVGSEAASVVPTSCSLAFDGEDVLVAGAAAVSDAYALVPVHPYLARLDGGDGHATWSTTLGEGDDVYLAPLAVGSGRLAVAGFDVHETAPSDSAFLTILDARTGETEREIEWPIARAAQWPQAVGLLPDGDISLVSTFTGRTTVVGADHVGRTVTTAQRLGAGFVARFDSDLRLRDVTALDAPGVPVPSRVAFAADGSFVSASSLSKTSVCHFDPDGHLASQWNTVDPTGTYGRVFAFALTEDGEAVLPIDHGLAATSPSGNEIERVAYDTADFLALAPSLDRDVVGVGFLGGVADFGAGTVRPGAVPAGKGTLFVARGKLW